jgi:regulator of protease activity HflC (stomatin/prohibitin superfamily)
MLAGQGGHIPMDGEPAGNYSPAAIYPARRTAARIISPAARNQLWASWHGSLSARPQHCPPISCSPAGTSKKDHYENRHYAIIVVIALFLLGMALSARIVKQYEQGVLFRLGRVRNPRNPGFRLIVPFIDVLHRVSLRIVTMPIQSQGIITRDNVSVDVSAVAYFRVVDAVKSVVAIENVRAAIDQIAQTTLRKVVGQHSLDQTLSETDAINLDIRKILDVTTVEWGVEVTLVELKDIQLPDSMKRAMARQAEAEREKRAKIINAEGESLAAAALGQASDIMMAHPLALQLRNLQSLVEIGVDKNTTVVFPAPLMTTIAELGSFLAREQAAASPLPLTVAGPLPPPAANGSAAS